MLVRINILRVEMYFYTFRNTLERSVVGMLRQRRFIAMAVKNTSECLIGCSMAEIVSFYTQKFSPYEIPTIGYILRCKSVSRLPLIEASRLTMAR
jgi:hypothetical protein